MIFSLSTISLFTLFSIFAFLVYFIAIPYLTLLTYKAKGYKTYFFPIIGEIYIWIQNFKTKNDIYAWTKELYLKHPDRKVMFSNFNNNIIAIIRDAKYAKDFYSNPQYYVKSGQADIFKPVVEDGGLGMLEGEAWKRHRKIIANSFHYESLRANINSIQSTVREFFDKLTPEDLKKYSVLDRLEEITGEVIGRTFLGERLNNYTYEGMPLTNAMAHLIGDLMGMALSPLGIFLGRKAIDYPITTGSRNLKKKITSIRKICLQIVKDRKESNLGGNDLLASLLETQKLSYPEMRLSDKEIVDEFMTFFIAGMDTTGHLCTMILYHLSQNPEYLKPLEKERKETYSKEKNVTLDTLQTMNELTCVIKETQRTHNPSSMPFYRVAVQDHTLGGELKIKKGTWIRAETFGPSHDPKHFENPLEYNPGRWKENSKKFDPYSYVPFAAGPRNCIGQHLAVAETKIIISEFLERFEYKVKDGYQLRMRQRFLYEPTDEMIFELTPKN